MSGPPTGSSPLHASGAIDAGGNTGTALRGLSLPLFHLTGLYVLLLEQPIDETECMVLVTFRGLAALDHSAVVEQYDDAEKRVHVRNSLGNPANAAFDVQIIRLRTG